MIVKEIRSNVYLYLSTGLASSLEHWKPTNRRTIGYSLLVSGLERSTPPSFVSFLFARLRASHHLYVSVCGLCTSYEHTNQSFLADIGGSYWPVQPVLVLPYQLCTFSACSVLTNHTLPLTVGRHLSSLRCQFPVVSGPVCPQARWLRPCRSTP